PDQAHREGECQLLERHETGPGLAQLCARPSLAEAERRRLTVFDSTGFALEDHFAVEVFLEAAAELGLGARLQVEHHPDDALDPYALAASPQVEAPGDSA